MPRPMMALATACVFAPAQGSQKRDSTPDFESNPGGAGTAKLLISLTRHAREFAEMRGLWQKDDHRFWPVGGQLFGHFDGDPTLAAKPVSHSRTSNSSWWYWGSMCVHRA